MCRHRIPPAAFRARLDLWLNPDVHQSSSRYRLAAARSLSPRICPLQVGPPEQRSQVEIIKKKTWPLPRRVYGEREREEVAAGRQS